MKETFKKGDLVVDRWWPEWGAGLVIKTMKTRIVVSFNGKETTYDIPHTQFLRRAVHGEKTQPSKTKRTKRLATGSSCVQHHVSRPDASTRPKVLRTA